MGLIYWLIGGVILGLLGGLRGPEIKRKIIPNQGIWNSALNAALVGLIGVLIGGLIGTSTGSINNIDTNNTWHILGLDFGLIFGLIFGGGKACIQHFILRLILWQNRYIPWNYAGFLDYATKLIFLQKVGGGYIFIHRMMLEHFAQMD